MTFIIQQTLLYAVPLMIVALAGVFREGHADGGDSLAHVGLVVMGLGSGRRHSVSLVFAPCLKP